MVNQSTISSDSQMHFSDGNGAPIYLINHLENNLSINSLNISHYFVVYDSVMRNEDLGQSLSLSYCSFSSNYANKSRVFYIRGINHTFYRSNIINNTDNDNNYPLFKIYGNIDIIDCCILSNKLNSGQFLISSDGTIIINNCTLPATNEYNISGTYFIQNEPSKSFIHWLKMTENSSYCDNQQDSVGDLIPIDPFLTPMKTKKLSLPEQNMRALFI